MAKIGLNGVMAALDVIMICLMTYMAVSSAGWISILMWIVAAILLISFSIRIRRYFSETRSN